MKSPARICCKLVGFGVGFAIGGPIVAALGGVLADLTHDLIGDSLGSNDELKNATSGLLGNVAVSLFPSLRPEVADYPGFNHDFRQGLLSALSQALRKDVPACYARNVSASAARRDIITRSLVRVADHLDHQAKQAIKSNSHSTFDTLFPSGQPDRALLQLQNDGPAPTAARTGCLPSRERARWGWMWCFGDPKVQGRSIGRK